MESVPIWGAIVTALLSGVVVVALAWIKGDSREGVEHA